MYGLHLGECLESMGCRRLEALINGLPPDSTSAVARSLDEGIRVGWGFKEELLAALIEVVDVGNRNFLLAHGVKKYQLPAAAYINRPLTPAIPPREAKPDDIKRIFRGGPVIVASDSDLHIVPDEVEVEESDVID